MRSFAAHQFEDIARVYTRFVHRPARQHAGDFEQTGLRDPPSARRPPELLPRIEQESEYVYDRYCIHAPRRTRSEHNVALAPFSCAEYNASCVLVAHIGPMRLKGREYTERRSQLCTLRLRGHIEQPK